VLAPGAVADLQRTGERVARAADRHLIGEQKL
jgi:hypothetical protein